MRWGPELLPHGEVRFRLWAPDRREVRLEREGAPALAMTAGPDGWFEACIEASPGDRYRFLLDDGVAVADPASRRQAGGVHGWSVLVNPTYAWRNDRWRGRPWREAVIQEVHVGAMGGFVRLADQLPALADLGVTAVQLMPVAAFAGARNWGYDGVLPYAVAEAYGGPDDLKALVDRAHDLGLMMFLDVVYNHFGPDGNDLGAYAGAFFDETKHTPWGGAVAVKRSPVRRFFIDNALMWLNEYRFDGLRFDAVHAIADDVFLDDMARAIRAQTGDDRHVHLILENERNDPERLSAGLYDAQWNDDFHNVLHVLLTGETNGYYADFAAEPTRKLARCLAEGFIHQGEPSPHRRGKARGAPSGHLPPTAFVSFLQNHDQIGNRALGERLTALADPAKLRAATALLLLCPQIPLIFMGDETGSGAPFLFFTDFHDALADAVREGRRREFASFPAFADPGARARIPDPNALETFERSRPTPGEDGEAWREFYRQLLALRRERISPALDGARAIGAEPVGEGAVAARWRLGDGRELELRLNVGPAPVTFSPRTDEPLFEIGSSGEPGSFQAWIA